MAFRKEEKLSAELAQELLTTTRQVSPFPGVDAGPPKTLFETKQCLHCQGVHSRKCPSVSSIEYYNDGAVKHVTYFPHGSWPEDQVIWLEDVYDALPNEENL